MRDPRESGRTANASASAESTMSRLADYFLVVGYDKEKERTGVTCGVILQRFPEKNWEDTPFIDGIEWFCQPQGWALSRTRQEPRFSVAVLTDVDANRHYCACLCFNETIDITPTKPADEEEDGETGRPTAVMHHTIMYAPKCLVLVSRLDHIETFRNCLGIMYTVYVENIGVPLETLVGNVLGCIQVPAPGGPQVRFSIGAGDRQALQPPASASLPVTYSSVCLLFQLMGIQNVITLWCGVMTEQRVLFKSQAYSRLSDACRALSALMFPFRYAHVYIPLLPAALAEVLNTPTPFLMGVHSSLEDEIDDLMDVIIADLDGGSLVISGGVALPKPSDTLMSRALCALRTILQPALAIADRAFPPPPQPPPADPIILDKQIRAIFMRLFAQLLQGYRSCLTIIRINPSPVITFHRAAFLGARGLSSCQFTTRLLDCMFFNAFVAERGPPWRVCDVWDELYSNMPEQLKMEIQDPNLEIVHIQELAKQLHYNENPNPQGYQQRVLRPPEGVSARIHQPPLPPLDGGRIQAIINEGLAKNNLGAKLSSMRPAQPRIVPAGVTPNPTVDSLCNLALPNSARRLEVLKNCVTCIFENKIADARKTFPAALRALRAPAARKALCAELAAHVLGNKAVLQHQQFELVIRLMNCALQDDSAMDEQGIAASLLPLATAFCRKLCTGVIQFAYMCIQGHPVWENQQFWEAAFYQDVQKEIKALYSSSFLLKRSTRSSPRSSPEAPLSDSLLKSQEPSALEIAAEQMRLWQNIDGDKQQELIKSEESTIYSQAIHYANRMVYLLVPLEAGKRQEVPRHHDDEKASNSITNSMVESDSADAESGFEEAETGDVGVNVIRMVSRFVDKVCTEGGVTTDHIRSLHQMVPGVVHMHMEILEAVSRESKRLPPVQKPRILCPCLVAGETIMVGGLRAILVSDGREDGGAALLPLLPAEGALFLTNYRIIFKGAPCDPFACEQTVVRAFPITALTKEKTIRIQYMHNLNQCLQDSLQLRSCTFQLIKIAFDEEVTNEQSEQFRKALGRLRYPPHVLQHFAFTGSRASAPLMPLHQPGEKHATLKGLAKKTLLKTARRAGFKPKTGKRQKYVLPSPGARSLTAPPTTPDDPSLEEIDLANNIANSSLGRKAERGYVRDWQRLGLVSDHFRLCSINATHTFCSSYPALFAVPANISDDSICRFARCYRQGRIPVLTWRHPRTGAILARSSASHNKGVIGMLKSSHPGQQSAIPGSTETTSSLEQERYLYALLAAGRAGWKGGTGGGGIVGWAFSESSLSLDSLLLGGAEESAPTPDTTRRHTNPLSRAMGTLSVFPRGSGGKGGAGGSSVSVSGILGGSNRQLGRWGSLKDRRIGSQAELQNNSNTLQRYDPTRNSTTDTESMCGEGGGYSRRCGLYIFSEKGGTWSVRGCEAVPVEYPDIRASKHAFKKLLRACVPSQPSTVTAVADPDAFLQAGTYYRLIEESGWLATIRMIMQLSGAVVDLLDAQGSSVCLSLEDGWDITAQVSSIAQLCLDPVYRTLDGFRTLVEKEWLALGHRFPQRSNIGSQPQAGFTPTFLQFLDVVHQIQRQFPLAFEFNEYYTKFLAYHYVSSRFRTFLFECEAQREEFGIAAAEDKRGSLNSRQRCVETGPGGSDDDSVYPGIGIGGIGSSGLSGGGSGSGRSGALGQSVFDYIEKQHQRSPIFFNFLYTPDFEHPVLRPQSSIACLDIWDYYTSEELSSGSPYEPDALQQERCRREECDAAEGCSTSLDAQRILVTAGYDGVAASLPDYFSILLERIRRLQLELGHLPQKWRVLWDKLELPTTDELARNASFSSAMVRSYGRAAHKRSTLDILVRARQAAQPALPGSGPSNSVPSVGVITGMQNSAGLGGGTMLAAHHHRFIPAHQTTPTQCDHCDQKLWGPVKTGVRCKDCGYTCHDRCAVNVLALCTKYKVADGTTATSGGSSGMGMMSGAGILSTSGGSDQPSSLHHQDNPSVNSSVATLQTSSQQYYDQFSSNVAENRTHEGHLYKRGNLLKAWKQRWFVLDSIKHQLRYYDAVEDSHCKGHIDLAEVVSVIPAPPAQAPPKKTDSKSFFDLRTSRRTFNFCAGDAISAQEWIEKLQACLQ